MAASYVTSRRYDRQGNLTNFIYPDGSRCITPTIPRAFPQQYSNERLGVPSPMLLSTRPCSDRAAKLQGLRKWRGNHI